MPRLLVDSDQRPPLRHVALRRRWPLPRHGRRLLNVRRSVRLQPDLERNMPRLRVDSDQRPPHRVALRRRRPATAPRETTPRLLSPVLRRRPERPGVAACDPPAEPFPSSDETRRSTVRRHRNTTQLVVCCEHEQVTRMQFEIVTRLAQRVSVDLDRFSSCAPFGICGGGLEPRRERRLPWRLSRWRLGLGW